AVFFGNGMFNTVSDAERSLGKLRAAVTASIRDEQLVFDYAYVDGGPVLKQLVNVAYQRALADYEDFWAWLGSVRSAPDWFRNAMLKTAGDAAAMSANHFNGIEEHLENYANYISAGYSVILVSHSQGNFYANQAMRRMGGYHDRTLSGS